MYDWICELSSLDSVYQQTTADHARYGIPHMNEVAFLAIDNWGAMPLSPYNSSLFTKSQVSSHHLRNLSVSHGHPLHQPEKVSGQN